MRQASGARPGPPDTADLGPEAPGTDARGPEAPGTADPIDARARELLDELTLHEKLHLLSGDTPGQAIVSGLGTGFMVALQITFWATLVFALLERTTGTTGLEHTWSVDDLPDVPDDDRLGVVEFAFTLVFDVLLIVGLLWVQLASPIVLDGVAYPLFDPALWSFWLPYFLVVIAVEIVFSFVVFFRGQWTYPLAVINAALSAAFMIPALWLLLNGQLFNPDLIAKLEALTGIHEII